jgi:tetratricopeptide (TPR) repeat protein
VGRFISGAIPALDYGDGAWDEALRQLDQFIADAEGAGGHAQEPVCRIYRGRIRFARDDIAGALEDAERGLAAARRIGDPQSMVPALGFLTWLLVELGRTREATDALDEMLESPELGGNCGPDVVVAMVELGRHDVDRVVAATPAGKWRDLFSLIAASKPADAAAVADEIGVRPAAALLRLHAARRLIAEGQVDEARGLLAESLAFWRSVQATRFIREAEELLAGLAVARPQRERTAPR